jgi:hypothetical protein
MPLIKPDEFGEWATGAGASIVKPTDAQIQQGWATSQKPPASFLNWKGIRDYQWSKFHEEARQFRESFAWADDGTAYAANQSPVPNYAPATLTITDASGPITLVGAGSGVTPMMSRALEFTPPNVNNESFYATTAKMVGFGAGSGLTIANFYWGLRIATKFAALPANDNLFYFVGLARQRGWSPAGNANSGMFGIRLSTAASLHWQFVMDANIVTLDAAHDPVVGTWQFWDIEFFGQGTPQGIVQGSQFGRLSLNGTIIETINGSPNAGDGNRYIAIGTNVDNTGPNGGPNFFASEYLTRWTVDA